MPASAVSPFALVYGGAVSVRLCAPLPYRKVMPTSIEHAVERSCAYFAFVQYVMSHLRLFPNQIPSKQQSEAVLQATSTAPGCSNTGNCKRALSRWLRLLAAP